MLRRHRQAHPLSRKAEKTGLVRRRHDCAKTEQNIHTAIHQSGIGILNRQMAQVQRDFRVLLPEPLDRLPDSAVCPQRGQYADLQLTGDMIRDLVQFRRRRAEHNGHPLQLGQQCPSGLRQPNALVRSVKNRHPKFLLQRLNMAAQGGLGQIEVCGRLGKILLPRRFQYTFQLHYRPKLRLHA